MKDLAPYSGQHQSLICREIEFDLRPAACAGAGRYRSAIADLPLTGEAAARVLVDVEAQLLDGQHKARLVRDPGDHLTKDALQERGIEMALVLKREVEVLREPICLEVRISAHRGRRFRLIVDGISA